MTFFYLFPALIILLLLLFLLTIWLRKSQYDAVHRNFLSIEEEFGGKVVRKNFLFRPFYAGKIKGRETRVGFTSEKYNRRHSIYIHYTMECKAKFQAGIIENGWYSSREEKSPENHQPLLNGKYLAQFKQEVSDKFIIKLENIIKEMPVFSYILIAKTGIIMERQTGNAFAEQETEFNSKTIKSMLKLAKLFEQ